MGEKDGFGPKSVENILIAIKTSSHTTFERFLCALGIPLIGATASRDLAIRFKTYNNFRDAIKNNFQFFTLPNYGWEKHNAIMKFNYDEADELAKNYIIFEESPIEQQVEKSLEGKTIVITGRLRQYPNRAALQRISRSMEARLFLPYLLEQIILLTMILHQPQLKMLKRKS